MVHPQYAAVIVTVGGVVGLSADSAIAMDSAFEGALWHVSPSSGTARVAID